jgi:hypothetical protein
MNTRTGLTSSFLVALLLVSLSAAAGQKDAGAGRERIAPNRMPVLEGESFAANIDAAGRQATAVLNISEGMVSLYLYYPDQNLLRVLYSVPAQTVRSGDTWHVTVPTRGVAFTLTKGTDQSVVIDGRASRLMSVERGEVEGARVEKGANCAAASTAETTGSQVKPGGPKAKEELASDCAFALAYNGCCSACYCVHRSLDIPYWVDSICCLGSC